MGEGVLAAGGAGTGERGRPGGGAAGGERRSWRERVAERFFGELIAARVAEAVSMAEEDRTWRALVPAGTADVPHGERLEELRDSFEAYRVNPIAYRIVELTTDFVLGQGVSLEASDPEVADWLRAWWAHPQNRLETRAYELCTELALAGELFVAFHLNPVDRTPYLRPIPASQIDGVETDPQDVEAELRYHRVSRPAGTATADGLAGEWLPAADPVRAPEAEAGGPWVRHYAVNRLPGAVRGQGDLVPLLPWLRRYKDWLTDRVRINRFKGAFLWDVKLTGASRRDVEAKRAELAALPPNPGAVLVHNESEEWTAVQPRMDAADVEGDGRAIRLMLAVGAGVPLHYLSEPEGSNRATAVEMGTPTLRHYERRQRYFGHVLADLARTAVTLSRRFPGRSYTVQARFEDLTTEDNERLASAAAQATAALERAATLGWIDPPTAARLFRKFIGEPIGGDETEE